MGGICSLPSHRAPGPDVYTGRFYKGCCSVIEPDIMAALLTSQQGNSLHLLVASHQNAFIQGCCIHDNYMMVLRNIKLLQ